MRRMFHTTTALLASLSLAVPGPVFSQDAALKCLDGTDVPCLPGQEPLDANGVPVEGTVMTEDEAAARAAALAAEAAAKAAEEAAAAEAAAQAEADAKAAEEAAAAEAAAAKAAEDAAAAEAAAQAEADAKAAAEAAAAEAAAAESAAAEAAKAAEDAAAAEAAAQAEADAKAAEEAAAAEAAAAEAANAAEDAAATDAAAQAEADAKAAEEAAAAQADADAKAAEEAAAAAAAQAEADAKAAEDAAAAEAAKAAEEAAAASETAEPAPAEEAVTATEPETAPVPEPTEEELMKALSEQLGVSEAGEAVAEPVPVPELPVQPDAATGEAPVASAAALPVEETASDEAAPVAEDVTVTEETVTEDSVRSSDEDFANKVNVTAADAVAETLAAPAATAAAAPAAKKDRLSDLEKALLIGLGAVAVGAIISNNRKVALNSGDRVVVTRDDGSYQVIKDDDTLLRQPGSRVRTERFNDGSTRTTVTRDDGTRVVTIRDAEYRVLRRVHIDRAGRQTVLIDDTVEFEPVDITTLPPPARQPVIRDTSDELALRLALEREARIGRRFSLAQVRGISEVRALVPVIDLDAITFDTGSAAISPDQARALSSLGSLIQSYIDENPREVFLVEGHSDATGGAAYNLALSDRRAESVALALTEYFGVPPENLVVQGYGEAFLKIDTQADERANRRASVRRITDLLRQAAAE